MSFLRFLLGSFAVCIFILPLAAQSPSDNLDLIKAIRDGETKKIDQLMKTAVGINAQDAYGWTPLMYAILQGKSKLAQQLLSYGANPNTQDHDGVTPLIAAVIKAPPSFAIDYLTEEKSKDKELPVVLLTRGADPNMADKEGNTPLLFAALDSKEYLIESLLAKGANPNPVDRYGCTPLFYLNNRYAASLWAPSGGVIISKYHLRRNALDASRANPDYIKRIATGALDSNTILTQGDAGGMEALKKAGGIAPDSPKNRQLGQLLIDSRPSRIQSVGSDPVQQVLSNYLRANKQSCLEPGCTIALMVRIGHDGMILDTLLLSGLPQGFSEQMLNVSKGLAYMPAKKNGEPVEFWELVTIHGSNFNRK